MQGVLNPMKQLYPRSLRTSFFYMKIDTWKGVKARAVGKRAVFITYDLIFDYYLLTDNAESSTRRVVVRFVNVLVVLK
jgi:hypothetical protein